MKPLLALTACAALVTGCSSIGTINGVPVNQPAQVSTQNAQSYCAQNPAICIVGGALALGAIGYLVNQSDDDSSAKLD